MQVVQSTNFHLISSSIIAERSCRFRFLSGNLTLFFILRCGSVMLSRLTLIARLGSVSSPSFSFEKTSVRCPLCLPWAHLPASFQIQQRSKKHEDFISVLHPFLGHPTPFCLVGVLSPWSRFGTSLQSRLIRYLLRGIATCLRSEFKMAKHTASPTSAPIALQGQGHSQEAYQDLVFLKILGTPGFWEAAL